MRQESDFVSPVASARKGAVHRSSGPIPPRPGPRAKAGGGTPSVKPFVAPGPRLWSTTNTRAKCRGAALEARPILAGVPARCRPCTRAPLSRGQRPVQTQPEPARAFPHLEPLVWHALFGCLPGCIQRRNDEATSQFVIPLSDGGIHRGRA